MNDILGMDLETFPTQAENDFFEKIFPWIKQEKHIIPRGVHYILDKNTPNEVRNILDDVFSKILFIHSYSFENEEIELSIFED